MEQLDNILRATGEEVLTHAGKISHAQAMEKAKAEYKRYQAQTLSPVEEEYLKTIKQLEKRPRQRQKNRMILLSQVKNAQSIFGFAPHEED